MKAQQQRGYKEKDNDPEAASAIAQSIELDRPGVEDHVEALIDEAVEETMICSDPPAYTCAKDAVTKSGNRDAMAKKQRA